MSLVLAICSGNSEKCDHSGRVPGREECNHSGKVPRLGGIGLVPGLAWPSELNSWSVIWIHGLGCLENGEVGSRHGFDADFFLSLKQKSSEGNKYMVSTAQC